MVVFLTGAAAFAVGFFISSINYFITGKILKSGRESALSAVSPVRFLLSAALLCGLYFLGAKTSLSLYALLIGGAAGLTAGLVLFTLLLMRKLRTKGQQDKERDKERK